MVIFHLKLYPIKIAMIKVIEGIVFVEAAANVAEV